MSQQLSPLLKTKLFIVRPRERLVERERLEAMLEDIPRRKLTLISASAGFGKTTLIGDWINRRGYPAAWVSLDSGDNAPERFFAYLIAALQTIHPALGATAQQALLMTPFPPLESLMTSLINDIASLPDDVVLVLDDYHVINNGAIHEALLFFLEHAPPQAHVIMTTRHDPSIPLARFRGRGEMLEIRASDLRFSVDDTAKFFHESMGLVLSKDDLEALLRKTEGWIAGLQMAALSLQGREDTSDFITAFTGANRYVFDYLLEEVISRQPEELQQAICEISILDQFNGSLCEAVTGRPNGAEMLAGMERANLFLISLDNRREWYRYHHLFGDLLLHRLQRMAPERIPELHRRASAWFEMEGFIGDAFQHAHASGDRELLAAIIENHWLDMLAWSQGKRLMAAIKTLPAERIARSASIMLLQVWTNAINGRMDELEPRIEELVAFMDKAPDIADRDEIEAHVTVIRAIIARDRGETGKTIELTEKALRLLPERKPGEPGYSWLTSHGVVQSLLGDAYHAQGDPTRAAGAFERSLQYGRTSGDLANQRIALINLAREHHTLGRLTEAMEDFEALDRILAASGGMIAPAPLHLELRAKVLFERYELDAARADAEEALGLVDANRFGNIIQANKIVLDLELTTGQWEEAEHRLAKLEGIATPKYWERYTPLVKAMRAELQLRTGDLAAAVDWAERHEQAKQETPKHRRTFFMSREEELLYCRILVATKEYQRVVEPLAKLQQDYETSRALTFLLRVLVLRSTLLQAQGRTDDGIDLLESALRLGAPERIVRPFCGVFGDVAPLLAARRRRRQGKGESLPREYIRAIHAIHNIETEGTEPVQARKSLDDLSQLTAREMEILQLLALGYSNRKIAEKLYVSVNTVKTHVANLFDKLDAQNRVEALARAKEASLL